MTKNLAGSILNEVCFRVKGDDHLMRKGTL